MFYRIGANGPVGWEGGEERIGTAVVSDENGETSCLGFFDENTFCTVCHLFSSEQLSLSTNEHTDGFIFFHMNDCSIVHSSKRTLRPLLVCAQPAWDTAVLLLNETFPAAPVSDDPFPDGTLLYPFSSALPAQRFDDNGITRYLFTIETQKGQSGYPIVDKTGSVNAIICAFDQTKKLTIATPSVYVKKTRDALRSYAQNHGFFPA